MVEPENLLGGAPQTLLPVDPAAAALAERDVLAVVRAYPQSSLCWAVLAEAALQQGTDAGDVSAYAYARTGYHRGLDQLRRNGWKGFGPVPWEHQPNRGFLRCLWVLARAAERIGEEAEAKRCDEFLQDASPSAVSALRAHTSQGA